MEISELGLSLLELRIILGLKYKGLKNGSHYQIAATLDRDANGDPVEKGDADIVEWRVPHLPKPSASDIQRVRDLFSDEIEAELERQRGPESPKATDVVDTGI